MLPHLDYVSVASANKYSLDRSMIATISPRVPVQILRKQLHRHCKLFYYSSQPIVRFFLFYNDLAENIKFIL